MRSIAPRPTRHHRESNMSVKVVKSVKPLGQSTRTPLRADNVPFKSTQLHQVITADDETPAVYMQVRYHQHVNKIRAPMERDPVGWLRVQTQQQTQKEDNKPLLEFVKITEDFLDAPVSGLHAVNDWILNTDTDDPMIYIRLKRGVREITKEVTKHIRSFFTALVREEARKGRYATVEDDDDAPKHSVWLIPPGA